MTVSKKVYEQIYALCSMDVNIAIIGEDIFTYTTFNASSSGNTSSIDFNTIYGICITEFINLEKTSTVGNPQLFYQQFSKFIERLEPMMIKFNKFIPYFLYSK